LIEITIIDNENLFEAYSTIPKELIILDNGRKLNLDKYLLQPAKSLSRVEGLVEMGEIRCSKYSIFHKEFFVGKGNSIRAAIQKNKIIPLLRVSYGKERSISTLWPILE
jgi:hypothetical protein